MGPVFKPLKVNNACKGVALEEEVAALEVTMGQGARAGVKDAAVPQQLQDLLGELEMVVNHHSGLTCLMA